MWFLVHGVHAALVLAGAVVIARLTSPDLSRRRRARRLRWAAAEGNLIELAVAQIQARAALTGPNRTRAVIVLHAYSFGLVATVVAVASARLAGAAWPGWPALAAIAVAFTGVGSALFARRRRPGRIAALAIGAQVLAHPVVVMVAQAGHGRGLSIGQGLTAALFCHRVGGTPSAAQVTAAAQRIGLHVHTAPVATATGFLSPAATITAVALLGAGGSFARFLSLDTRVAGRRAVRSGAATRSRIDACAPRLRSDLAASV